jgi:dipeptidase E
MTKIVAIWGWWWAPENIKEVNEKIFSICKKNNPKILFIPTAKSDDEEYCNIFKNHYESLWGKVDFLFLIKEKTSFKEIEEKILNSDIVYVWWWNTLKMMTLWRKLWVDKVLKKALEKDIVLAWTSAWAICWFKYWNSDSRKFTSNSDKLIKVTWLNFVNAFICPHYSGEINRQSSLKDMLKKNNMVWIALDDLSAISIENDNFEIITSSQNAKWYKFYWKKWEYIKEEIVKWKLKDLVKK